MSTDVETDVEKATERLRVLLENALMNLPADNDDIEKGYELWKAAQLFDAVTELVPGCSAWLDAMRASSSSSVKRILDARREYSGKLGTNSRFLFDREDEYILEGARVYDHNARIFGRVVEVRFDATDKAYVVLVFDGHLVTDEVDPERLTVVPPGTKRWPVPRLDGEET